MTMMIALFKVAAASIEINETVTTNMMPHPLVKKDTTSHDIVHGSSSAKISRRRNMVCCSSPVVKKVTSSHDSHCIVQGSSSTTTIIALCKLAADPRSMQLLQQT
jgi:hypothetical protein